MAKLPYMPLYVADYLRDTRCLSLATRGAWMDMMCALWNAPKRGRRTLTMEGWAGEVGKPSSEVSLAIIDLERNKVGKIIRKINAENIEEITIMSMRMLRDEEARKRKAKQKQYQRDKAMSLPVSPPCPQDVEAMSPGYIRSQSQKSESEEELREEKKRKTPLRATDDETWLTALKANPAYSHLSIDTELAKMDAWLSTRPGRQKTRKFIVNWLNKVEKPLQVNGTPAVRAAPIPPFPGPEDPIGRNLWRKAYGHLQRA